MTQRKRREGREIGIFLFLLFFSKLVTEERGKEMKKFMNEKH